MAMAGTATQWSLNIPSLIKQSASSVLGFRSQQPHQDASMMTTTTNNNNNMMMAKGQKYGSRSAGSFNVLPSQTPFWDALPHNWPYNSSSNGDGDGDGDDNSTHDDGGYSEGQGGRLTDTMPPSTYNGQYYSFSSSSSTSPLSTMFSISSCGALPGLKEIPTLIRLPSQCKESAPLRPLEGGGEAIIEKAAPVESGTTGEDFSFLLDPLPAVPATQAYLPITIQATSYSNNEGDCTETLSIKGNPKPSCSLQVSPKRKHNPGTEVLTSDDASPSKKRAVAIARKLSSSMMERNEEAEMSEVTNLPCNLPTPPPLKTRGGRGGTAMDPQSVAARSRREKLSQRMKTLQSMLPNGEHLDTVATLGQTLEYIRFLQHRVWELCHDADNPALTSSGQLQKWQDFI